MLKKLWFALFKRLGFSRIKRYVWDQEYQAGKWDELRPPDAEHAAERDIVLDVVEKYSANGAILDLGCGPGATGNEIALTYRSYLGVDVSTVAVQQAVELTRRQPARVEKNRYVAADIGKFTPDGKFSVILFRECIYYFPKGAISRLLARYSGFLEPAGLFIVRLHDRHKYRGIMALIEAEYKILERLEPPESGTAVLVFSPRGSAGGESGVS